MLRLSIAVAMVALTPALEHGPSDTSRRSGDLEHRAESCGGAVADPSAASCIPQQFWECKLGSVPKPHYCNDSDALCVELE